MKIYQYSAVLCLALFCNCVIAQNSTDSRTLFTVAGKPVTVSEFEYVYNKNNVNNQADYSEKSLRDYLNLYENFRLKVMEAEAMSLDTITSLKTELEGYRKQLAKSYLTDREISDKLIKEAYDRSKIEVNASHILVKCTEDANPADTLAAYNKALEIRNKLLYASCEGLSTKKAEKCRKKMMKSGAGNTVSDSTFARLAKQYSDDPSAKTNGGNIGWFTVFGTIYPFENAAYTLKPGELSMPVRTEFGYHLVKLNGTRAARGQIHVAHLLIRFGDKPTQVEIDSVKRKVDSVATLISTGKMTFDDAVKNFSDDKASRVKGGELQWFGSGSSVRMIPEFEDAAFALKKDGDITQPVMTQFGWHLIKRLEKREIPTFEEAKADMKKKVERDTRSQVAKNILIARIKKDNNFTEAAGARAEYAAKIDSGIFKGNWKGEGDLRSSKTLFTFAGKNYTYSDFSDYIEKNSKRRVDKNKDALISEYYDNFVTTKALEYEESMLDSKKPEFKNLMKEYRDGILLFELMDRQVWTKAVKDTLGLEEFRKKNETKYMWGDRADVIIFNCNDPKICNSASTLAPKLKSGIAIKDSLNKDGKKAHVSTIEGKYEKGQYDVVDKIEWKPGVTPVEKLNDSSYRFVYIKQVVGPEPKSLKEAKGYIVSDYQEYLEKTWLAELRNKYPITVDDAVLRSLIKK